MNKNNSIQTMAPKFNSKGKIMDMLFQPYQKDAMSILLIIAREELMQRVAEVMLSVICSDSYCLT